MKNLTVRLVQFNIVWCEPEVNRTLISSFLATNSDPVDLIVLPEMFTTGFIMDPEKESTAEVYHEEMETLLWMKKEAKKYDAVIMGSVAVEENGTFKNRMLIVDPDGAVLTYDKIHLFTLTGENVRYTPGNEVLIFEWRGWKILPQICYDLRFPESSRNQMQDDGAAYDLLVYVANWPESRVLHWERLIQARAIENQAYALGVNRTGKDGNNLNYIGHSVTYDYKGTELIGPLMGNSEVVTVRLEKEEMNEYRVSFPFLGDID